MRRKKDLPPRRPPRDGFREFPRREAKVFSDSFVQKLARSYKIEDQRVPELKRALEGWADVYFDYKEEDERPRAGKIKAEIEDLRTRIDELRLALERLTDDAEQLFWWPEGLVRPDPFSDANLHTSDYGHMIRLIPHAEGGKAIIRIEKHHHFESLLILRNYCEAAIRRLYEREDRGGRKRSEALRMWAVNTINYWESPDCLNRRFALKCYKGEPITQGALFTIEAFQPIDPTISVARHVTAMRHAMKTRRKRVAGTQPK